MDSILGNERFATAFRQLAAVRLNPRRHTAPNAMAHSEAVAAHAVAIGRANLCTDAELRQLEDLGLAHDIGKITGTARPERSLEVLRDCGIEEPQLLRLVKWHDTSLPWYLAQTRGQPASEKAWRRLASEVDVRALLMFMVADRVDAPPGWRGNAPTAWFLEEARARGLVAGLQLDLADHPSEVSAGGVLVRAHGGAREALVIRVRAEGYELPKGGIEWDELPGDAAGRETREEAGVASPFLVERELGHVDYFVERDAGRHLKRVRYFLLGAAAPVELGALPRGTRERRWVREPELDAIPWTNDALPAIVRGALGGPDAR